MAASSGYSAANTSVSVTVSGAAPNLTYAASSASTYGTASTVTAHVTGISGSGIAPPTGSITLTIDGGNAVPAAIADGQAQFTVPAGISPARMPSRFPIREIPITPRKPRPEASLSIRLLWSPWATPRRGPMEQQIPSLPAYLQAFYLVTASPRRCLPGECHHPQRVLMRPVRMRSHQCSRSTNPPRQLQRDPYARNTHGHADSQQHHLYTNYLANVWCSSNHSCSYIHIRPTGGRSFWSAARPLSAARR